MADPRPARGRLGEELAAEKLRQEGFCLVGRNYRCRLGEIDLIAEKKGALYIVEVKTSTSDSFGLPQERVNYRKQMKIKRVTAYYLAEQNGFDREIHFMVAAVRLDRDHRCLGIELLADAFY